MFISNGFASYLEWREHENVDITIWMYSSGTKKNEYKPFYIFIEVGNIDPLTPTI